MADVQMVIGMMAMFFLVVQLERIYITLNKINKQLESIVRSENRNSISEEKQNRS